ncbi:MAG: hypothetical protein WBM02_01840 [bacterium]
MTKRVCFGIFIVWVTLALLLSGCDKFKSWFDTTMKDTTVKPQEKANMTKLKADLKTINSSIEIFHAQHGRYPDSLEELARLGAMQVIPREPFGGIWLYDRYDGTVKSSTYPEVSAY